MTPQYGHPASCFPCEGIAGGWRVSANGDRPIVWAGTATTPSAPQISTVSTDCAPRLAAKSLVKVGAPAESSAAESATSSEIRNKREVSAMAPILIGRRYRAGGAYRPLTDVGGPLRLGTLVTGETALTSSRRRRRSNRPGNSQAKGPLPKQSLKSRWRTSATAPQEQATGVRLRISQVQNRGGASLAWCMPGPTPDVKRTFT